MPRFLTINDAPGVHAPSWYSATANPAPERPALDGDMQVEALVIGGGFAGVSAAYHLAGRGVDTALIDAHRIGWGASGRNGGQVAAQPRREMSFYESALGLENAKKIFDLAMDANGLVRDLIARHGIACDLRDGVLGTNHRADYDAPLEAEGERLATVYGHPGLTYLDRSETQALVRSEDVHASLLDRRAAHLHPMNFVTGLAAAAEGRGARLYERTAALRLHLGGDKPVVETASGRITARKLILALNGYHDGLEPRLAARVMPINNFILATEPLPDGGASALTAPIAVADSRFVVNYYRLSADGRMLFGSGESSRARFPGDLKTLVRERMLRLFPQLAEARIDYGWGGTLGITASRAPYAERIAEHTVSIAGWSGSGVHMATMGGALAAAAIAEEASADKTGAASFDLLAAAPTPAFPGGARLRAPILAMALFWFGMKDRL